MTRTLGLAALLLLFAPAASADPITLVATLAPYIGGTMAAAVASAAAFVAANAVAIGFISAQVYGAANARRKARRNAARQRAEYNTSLQDRSVLALQAAPPWRIIYGDVVTGGDIVGIFTTDKSGVRTDGTGYTKVDGLKHLVIAIAAHECEAIDDVLIDGVSLGPLDGTGRPTAGEFAVVRTETREISIPSGASSVQPYPVTVLSALDEFQTTNTSGDGSYIVYGTYTLSAGNTTITNTSANPIRVAFTMEVPQASVRVQKHLGSDTQTVDTYLNGLIPTQWTTNHRLRGICYAIVTLDLETQRFQGGPPGITFRVRGRKVFDTRTGTTAYSTNPALCIRDYLTAKWGFDVPAASVDTAFCNAAANACDALISLTVGPVTVPNQRTYTLNGMITTADSKEAVLEDMCESMAGYAVYGATWQIIAGVWTAPVMDLTDADLVGQIDIVQADVGTEDLFNGVRGTYIALGKAAPTEFDSYQNATFVAADGQELWADVTLPFTSNKARARNLARILVERNRNGQVIRYPAKLRAWPLQVGDRVRVTSAEYGWTLKTYRVTDWQFGITSPVLLTLQEDDAAAWDLADAATADPTPNTDLPNPNVVQTLTGLSATSGTTELLGTGDGSVVTRVRVSWAAPTGAYITDGGGQIEVIWRRVLFDSANSWQTVRVSGSEVRAFILGAVDGDVITIGVRAINSLGRTGNYAWLTHTVIGKTAAPINVAGLTATAIAGAVRISWTPNEELDYATTELRRGASWSTGVRVDTGGTGSLEVNGSGYDWAWPALGTYTILARHRDTSGNLSAATASVGITVTAAGLAIGASGLSVAIGGGNITNNSSFEVDSNNDGRSDSWEMYFTGSTGSVSYTRSSAGGRRGTNYQRVDAAALGTSGNDRAGIRQDHNVDGLQDRPGSWSIWAYAAVGNGWKPQLYVEFLNASSAIVGVWDTGALATPAAGVWVRHSVAGIIPTSAVTARAYYWMAQSVGTSQAVVSLDDAMFCLGDVLPEWTPRADEILAGAVDTLQLAGGAATSTGASFANAVAVTNAYFTPDGYTRNTQITTVAFTPIVDCDVLLTVSYEGSYTTGATNNLMSFRGSIQQVGGTWSNSVRQTYELGNIGVSTSRVVSQTITRRVSVTAGVAYTFGLYCTKFDGTDTVTLNNVEMRYEVIKR